LSLSLALGSSQLTHSWIRVVSYFFSITPLQGQKDDKYIVLVVDQFGGRGNVLNFNVGDGVKFALPNVFWTRLQSKYGSVSWTKE